MCVYFPHGIFAAGEAIVPTQEKKTKKLNYKKTSELHEIRVKVSIAHS